MSYFKKLLFMKKASLSTILGGLAILLCTLHLACGKPFKDMQAILSNDYLSHRVTIKITDATPGNADPANVNITIKGPGVLAELIYNDNGTKVVNNDKVIITNNVVSLAVMPYYVISKNAPIEFTVVAEADGYYTTGKDIVISYIDSLQYVDIQLLKKPVKTDNTPLPIGITYQDTTIGGITNGTIGTGVVIPINQVNASTTAPSNTTVSIGANTTFIGTDGQPINSSQPLIIEAVNFNDTTGKYIPGGVNEVKTNTGREVSLLVAAALEISASIGGVHVDSFSKPIIAHLGINKDMYNIDQDRKVAVGDQMEIWSRKDGGTVWNFEGYTNVFKDINGDLGVDVLIKHLSVWAVGFASDLCPTPLEINYQSNRESINIHYVTIREQQGTKQLLFERKIQIKNGEVFKIRLPKDVDYTVNIYEGSFAEGIPYELNIDACTSSLSYVFNYPDNRPALHFDLKTQCDNSSFSYTGSIDFRPYSKIEKKWKSFTPSVEGTVNTSMLEFGVMYDFRIIYGGKSYIRKERIVKPREFQLITDSQMPYEEYKFTGYDTLPAPRTSFITQVGECP